MLDAEIINNELLLPLPFCKKKYMISAIRARRHTHRAIATVQLNLATKANITTNE